MEGRVRFLTWPLALTPPPARGGASGRSGLGLYELWRALGRGPGAGAGGRRAPGMRLRLVGPALDNVAVHRVDGHWPPPGSPLCPPRGHPSWRLRKCIGLSP